MNTKQQSVLLDLFVRLAFAFLLWLILQFMAQASVTLQENLNALRFVLILCALGGVDRRWRILFNLLMVVTMVFAMVV